MKFTKLRILGFKSFVEPTEFLIERGLTGVVGPNGCGKSNLVEAIRWVMGESSFKNMRASGMDEVIFSGSSNRPARNTAEVTLVVDNSERTAPTAFNDSDTIEISRRIERDAGSVYRINGKEARAKDVQLLFADASTGARSPSMVGQGRIGELISAKPRQRRLILEEAAGISGLHTRRHEAELRLKATEQNLDRLEDVITQLDTQLENLKRQARQASRYRNLSGEIRKFEATVYHLRWTSACSSLDDADEALKRLTLAVADATALQSKAARDQAVFANNLPPLRDKAAAASAALQRIQLEQGALEKEESQAKDRLHELSNRITQLNHDISREQSLLKDNKDVFERLAVEEKTLNTENLESDERRQQAETTLKTARDKQETSERAFNATTKEIAELNARRNGLENSVSQAENQISRLKNDTAKIIRDIEDLDEKLSQDLFISAHEKLLNEAHKLVTECETNVGVCEQATQEARDAENKASSIASTSEKELSALETEAETLTRVLNIGSSDDWPRLIDGVSAETGFEAALAVALGDDLDVATDKKAPVHWSGSVVSSDDPTLPDGAITLSNFVAAPDLLKRRLLQIGVVEEADAASLAKHLKPGQRLVTREGGLWRWDGFVAAADAETPAAQRLEQKNRLLDLNGALTAKREQIEVQSQILNDTQRQLNAAIVSERNARETLRTRMVDEAKARDVLAKTQSDASRLTERRAALIERQMRLNADHERARAMADNQEKALNEVPDSDTLNNRLQNEQSLLAQDRGALAEARATFETLAREADMRKTRLAAIENERKSWVNRVEAVEKHISVLSERKSKAISEQETLNDTPAEFARKRALLFSKVEEAENNRTSSQDALSKAEADVRSADEAAKQTLTALSEIRESRARAEERVESATARKHDVGRDIAEILDCSPAQLRNMAGLKDGASLPEAAGIESRLERLKAERERLGGVNLRADLEIQEIDQKRTDIIHERDDLIEAVRKLRSAIASLNKEGRERLLKAFDEVNDHFRKLFTSLFGGGTAELQLTESDDPLEAGLDIMARPPGKKPQSMTLLSGGEQALTALALIFAVFLTNPAPICVLDEVDAPLDDANVERFCALLDDMIAITQTRFLTITHNPITMARMGRLFGVTMAERGVSQLVSVDLETAESFREAG